MSTNSSLSPTVAPTGILDEFLADLPRSTQQHVQQSPYSPQSKAFYWLSNHWNVTHLPNWRRIQLFALATFYYAFDGENWPYGWNKDWLDDKHQSRSECDWFSHGFGSLSVGIYSEWQGTGDGVEYSTCDNRGRFQNLHISYLNLSGYSTVLPLKLACCLHWKPYT